MKTNPPKLRPTNIQSEQLSVRYPGTRMQKEQPRLKFCIGGKDVLAFQMEGYDSHNIFSVTRLEGASGRSNRKGLNSGDTKVPSPCSRHSCRRSSSWELCILSLCSSSSLLLTPSAVQRIVAKCICCLEVS